MAPAPGDNDNGSRKIRVHGTINRHPDASMEKVHNKVLYSKRVLVVEDDAFAAFDIMKTLREAGAEILPVLVATRGLLVRNGSET